MLENQNNHSHFEIKNVPAEITWPIRNQVMWPNFPQDFVKLKNDTKGKHFGVFVNDKIVSCISLFVEGDSAQFRKLATKQEYQGKGYGSALIDHVINAARKMNVKRIWCNARADKVRFYTNFGLIQTKERFFKQGIEFVIMERIL